MQKFLLHAVNVQYSTLRSNYKNLFRKEINTQNLIYEANKTSLKLYEETEILYRNNKCH